MVHSGRHLHQTIASGQQKEMTHGMKLARLSCARSLKLRHVEHAYSNFDIPAHIKSGFMQHDARRVSSHSSLRP